MKQYDLIYWGWDNGTSHRKRDPITVSLKQPLAEGQRIDHGDIPEIDEQGPRYPLTVTSVSAPETRDSHLAYHITERKTCPE